MKICRSLLLLLLVVCAVLALSSAAVASDVSGTVTYFGAKTGRIYISLESQYNSSQAYGTSIVSAGTFTIRGVPEGGYTLIVRLDAVGNRERHPADPIYIDSSIYVPANNVSGVNLFLDDPSPAAPQPPETLDIVPSDGSALLLWEPQRDQNGIHGSEAFNLYWSTDPSFLSSWPTVSAEGSITGIKSSDNDNGYFHTGITNGQTYYYLMTGTTGTLVSAGTVTAMVTPASPVGGYEVSGTITASGFDPAGSTLHVVLYSDTDGVFYSIVTNPSVTQSFTVAGVQDGTYFVYPIYDMNGNGLLDMGDVMPSDGESPSSVTVSGSNESGVDATLTASAGSSMAGTSHWKRDNGCSEGYNINLRAEDGLKLIANVALTSAPTNSVGINGPIDLASNEWGEFSYYAQTGRPAVGDSFDFAVEYTDGTTETLNAEVTAVLDDFPVPVSPMGVIANDPTPTFSWSELEVGYNYTYQLYLYGQGTNWSMWDMPSSKLSAVYNENSEANPSTLTGNQSYEWSISLRDDDGNEAQTQVNFGMGSGISGAVTNGITGIGCVQVSVVSAVNGSPVAWTRTNPDGTYAVGVATAGDYKVEFMGNYAGYISEWYDNQTSWTTGNAVSVLADQVNANINAVLSQAGSISGQVTNGTIGIANVWVEAYDASTYSHMGSSQTDADGNYTINGLPTGTYKVGFGGVAGYAMEWYDDAQDQASATGVNVISGSVTPGISAVLSASGGISGQVTNGTTGIQNVSVSACRIDNPSPGMCSPYYYANTNSNGDYFISSLPTGSYHVQFSGGGAGYTSEWYDDTQDMNLAAPVGVTAGATTTDIDAVLAQAGNISGGVTNGLTGIQGVFVYVCKYVGPAPNDCTYGFGGTNTDAGGNYTLTGLPAGQYEVQFQGSMSGYTNEWYDDSTDQTGSTLVSVTTGSTTAGINAVLAQAGSIVGRVTSNGTNGISGVCVNVAQASTGINVAYSPTDAGGYYTVNGLAGGQYKVSFGCAAGYADEWYNDKPDFATADAVTVTGGIITTGLDAVLASTESPIPFKIGIFDPATAMWYLDYNGSGSWDGAPTDVQAWHGSAGVIPVTGDWNGDGKTKIGVYDPAAAMWYLDYNGNGLWDGTPTDRLYWHGFAGAIPVTGDWNGDGITDIGVYDGGMWYVDYNGNGSWDGTPTDRVYWHGYGSAMPVTGDWNGDSITEIGVYDPATAQWYLDYNGNGLWDGTPADVQSWHGFAGVIPVTGDWNGDGKTEIGIYDPSTAMWYLDKNGNGAWDGTPTDDQYWHGYSGVTPVTGKW